MSMNNVKEQVKVEDYPAMARRMADDLRTGGMAVLANRMAVASLFDSIATRLEFLENQPVRSSGALTLERERAILHISIGDDHWNPTEAEINEIVEKFKTAEYDKNGVAFVGTRHGVNVTEITGDGLGTIPLPIAPDE